MDPRPYIDKKKPMQQAKSQCCGAIIKASYKKLIPNTTLISKEVDFFYCTRCNCKLQKEYPFAPIN